MKITEIILETSNSPLLTAIELLKGRIENSNSPAKIRTDSLIQLVRNTGVPFDFDALAHAVNNDKAVGELIKNFNKYEVIFNTGSETISGTGKKDPGAVEKMAKRALNKRM